MRGAFQDSHGHAGSFQHLPADAGRPQVDRHAIGSLPAASSGSPPAGWRRQGRTGRGTPLRPHGPPAPGPAHQWPAVRLQRAAPLRSALAAGFRRRGRSGGWPAFDAAAGEQVSLTVHGKGVLHCSRGMSIWKC